ncbi:Gonadal protein gdl, putative, partial [Ixodes scapularis]
LAQKEHLQQRHYALFRELQLMSGELPQSYQQRLPYELLSSLANSLLDGTVYEIVRGLKDIQLMDEKSLFETRKAVLTLSENRRALFRRRPFSVTTAKNKMPRPPFQESNAPVSFFLFFQVSDQQVTLEKAGVPGFFVTNSPMEISLQMCLLEFITRLAHA